MKKDKKKDKFKDKTIFYLFSSKISYFYLLTSNVQFIFSPRLTHGQKEKLLFAIFTAENNNINGQAKVDYIGKKMESDSGGSWSVHSYIGQKFSVWDAVTFLARFTYDGKEWIVYQNEC